MQYTAAYDAPVGSILLAGDETGLTGLWISGSKYYADSLDTEREEKETVILKKAKSWLDIYFSGKEPDFTVPIHLIGTPFRLMVWEVLQQIPYGKTMTYGEIARIIAEKAGRTRMSAQAVGGAIGHNPISIIIPCHRVVGTDGSLTGYAGGVAKKAELLALEGVDMSNLRIPTKGTAL